ncbi:hypothetical protein EYF80_019530 [Liparis tanakae]|uniref:Uncharacterized protein n=1 Tax=Liparis tanakae TaxID=230148 RepID=A0A4Z2HWT5_9TELE|nr:hypothetical protein EYF80_019530 [Liparis tanakae]
MADSGNTGARRRSRRLHMWVTPMKVACSDSSVRNSETSLLRGKNKHEMDVMSTADQGVHAQASCFICLQKCPNPTNLGSGPTAPHPHCGLMEEGTERKAAMEPANGRGVCNAYTKKEKKSKRSMPEVRCALTMAAAVAAACAATAVWLAWCWAALILACRWAGGWKYLHFSREQRLLM